MSLPHPDSNTTWREELTSATAYIYVPLYQLQCGPHKCHVEVKNGIMVAGGRIYLLMNYVEVPFLYQINVLFFVKSNGSFFYEINWLFFFWTNGHQIGTISIYREELLQVKSPADQLQVRNKKRKKINSTNLQLTRCDHSAAPSHRLLRCLMPANQLANTTEQVGTVLKEVLSKLWAGILRREHSQMQSLRERWTYTPSVLQLDDVVDKL
jgi:hypothetical protein